MKHILSKRSVFNVSFDFYKFLEDGNDFNAWIFVRIPISYDFIFSMFEEYHLK